jgi:hypothetical protein
MLPVSAALAGDVLTAAVDTTGALWPVVVDPTTSVNSSPVGYVYKTGVTYLGARNGTEGTNAWTGAEWHSFSVGANDDNEMTWYVYRGCLRFELPDMQWNGCTAATLFLNGYADNAKNGFDSLYVIPSTWGPTLETTDYNKFPGWVASGAYNTATKLTYGWCMNSYSSNWNQFVFKQTGLDEINNKAYSGGILDLMVMCEHDYYGNYVGSNEYIEFESTGNIPYLSLTYSIPSINPEKNFYLTPIPGHADSLRADWTIATSANIDSLRLFRVRAPGDTVMVKKMATKTTNTCGINGLNPYEKYKFFVRADSSTIFSYSNTAEMWTMTEFSRAVVPIPTLDGVHPVTARYDSARTESKADSLFRDAYPVYRLGQSTFSGQRVNRISIMCRRRWWPR